MAIGRKTHFTFRASCHSNGYLGLGDIRNLEVTSPSAHVSTRWLLTAISSSWDWMAAAKSAGRGGGTGPSSCSQGRARQSPAPRLFHYRRLRCRCCGATSPMVASTGCLNRARWRAALLGCCVAALVAYLFGAILSSGRLRVFVKIILSDPHGWRQCWNRIIQHESIVDRVFSGLLLLLLPLGNELQLYSPMDRMKSYKGTPGLRLLLRGWQVATAQGAKR